MVQVCTMKDSGGGWDQTREEGVLTWRKDLGACDKGEASGGCGSPSKDNRTRA